MAVNRLKAISPFVASCHIGLLGYFLSFPCLALLKFFQHFDPTPPRPQAYDGLIIWVVSPIVLALFASLGTLVACVTYNVIAKMLGGIRYESEE